jgi:hypothetical protein
LAESSRRCESSSNRHAAESLDPPGEIAVVTRASKAYLDQPHVAGSHAECRNHWAAVATILSTWLRRSKNAYETLLLGLDAAAGHDGYAYAIGESTSGARRAKICLFCVYRCKTDHHEND